MLDRIWPKNQGSLPLLYDDHNQLVFLQRYPSRPWTLSSILCTGPMNVNQIDVQMWKTRRQTGTESGSESFVKRLSLLKKLNAEVLHLTESM